MLSQCFSKSVKRKAVFSPHLAMRGFFGYTGGGLGGQRFVGGVMNKPVSVIGLALFLLMFSTFVGNAQDESKPQKVETSTGIYDVESRDEIYKLSARSIRKLVQMENARRHGFGTLPHPILVYCFDEKTFRYTGGKYQNEEIKYRLYTPKTIQIGQKYPLVVHLHGTNDDSLTNAHPILPLLLGPNRQDFFMLVTQSPKGAEGGWFFRPSQDGTLDVLMAAMEHVIAENPIDEKRITATGISGGGWGVWELLLRYPDMFAGAVPTACGAPPPSQRLAALTKTRIWTFVYENDRGVNRESIQSAIHTINGAGGSMALTTIKGSGHNTWKHAMGDHNCLLWMLAQKRGSWFSPPPGTIVRMPNSWLFIPVMYIVPLTIIVFFAFLSRGKIYDWVSDAWRTIRERMGS
jgi:predicted esterase/uncharacterized membrane protein